MGNLIGRARGRSDDEQDILPALGNSPYEAKIRKHCFHEVSRGGRELNCTATSTCITIFYFM